MVSRRLFSFVSFLTATFLLSAVLFSVLLALSPCFLLTKSQCYRGYASKYSFDAGAGSYSAWMSVIPDATNLSSLSIPGTHDTLTYDIADQIFQCQNHNLTTQLRAGLRYVDVRARVRDNELEIYHGDMYTGHSYAFVLQTLFDFLDNNPSEVIIMRLKEEGAVLGNTTIDFEEAFNHYRFNSSDTAEGCAKHLYIPDSFTTLPTLGVLRSKILILQNFNSTGGPYGIGWESPTMVLEDLWQIQDVDHLYLKWAAIQSALVAAASDPYDNHALYLSHLSAAVGVLPIQAAAGPLNHTVAGMNDETGAYLTSNTSATGRTGIVIIDFPGQRLINAILDKNHGLMT